MSGIDSIDADTTSCVVTQHDIDATIADDFEDRSPCVVREAVYALGIPAPPLGCSISVGWANMPNLASPASLPRYRKVDRGRGADLRHGFEKDVKGTLCV